MERGLIEGEAVKQTVRSSGTDEVRVKAAGYVPAKLSHRSFVQQVHNCSCETHRLTLADLKVLRKVEIGLVIPWRPPRERISRRDGASGWILRNIDPLPPIHNINREPTAGVRNIESCGKCKADIHV